MRCLRMIYYRKSTFSDLFWQKCQAMQKACSSSAQSGSVWGSLVFSEVSEAVGTTYFWPCLDTELSEMRNFESLCEVFSILACSWKAVWSEHAEELEAWVTSFGSWARASWISEGEKKLCFEFYLQAQCLKANQSQETKTQHCKAQGNKLESSYEALNSFQLTLSGDTWGRVLLQPRLKWAELFLELSISHHWLKKEPIMIPVKCMMLSKLYWVLFFLI